MADLVTYSNMLGKSMESLIASGQKTKIGTLYIPLNGNDPETLEDRERRNRWRREEGMPDIDGAID